MRINKIITRLFPIITLLLINFFVTTQVKAEATGCCEIKNVPDNGIVLYTNQTPTQCTGYQSESKATIFHANQKVSDDGKSCIANTNSTPPAPQNRDLTPPVLSVSIPGFGNFTTVHCDKNNPNCAVPWIAEYIKAIFSYSVLIVGILAVIMMMIGGVIWLTGGGNQQRISEGKKFIQGGVFGMVVMISSYLILFIVNPNLTILAPVNIKYIDSVDTPDLNAPIVNSGPQGVISQVTGGTANCPGTGGSGAVYNIANSLQGKVTYRYGGKGGPPPYSADTKTCDNKPCSSFCPEGTVCLDCSGFVNHVLKCAGLPFINSGTSDIFSGAEAITSLTNTAANGKELKGGDLLGNPSTGSHIGHVLVYVGNGKVAESHGGSGREAGNSMRISDTTDHGSAITYIRRISP